MLECITTSVEQSLVWEKKVKVIDPTLISNVTGKGERERENQPQQILI